MAYAAFGAVAAHELTVCYVQYQLTELPDFILLLARI